MQGSAVGDLLSGFGPGLLSGIGKALGGDSGGPNGHRPGDTPDPKPPTSGAPGTAHPNSFKHGGIVKKTGVALVHKGEKVIPAGGSGGHNFSLHRALADMKTGGLHRALKVPEGEDIPKDKLDAARNSDNPHVAHMANFAHTLGGFKKK